GYCAIGNPRMHTPPMSVIRIAMTIATIGRLTKNSDMAQRPDGDVDVAAVVWSAGGVHSFTLTVEPSRAFWTPCTTTLSPGFKPSVTSHNAPMRSPVFTGRMLTLLFSSTTAT